MKNSLIALTALTALIAVAFTACDSAPDPKVVESTPPAPASVAPSVPAEEVPLTPAELERAAEGKAAIEDILGDPDAFARVRRLSTLLPTLGPEVTTAIKEILGDTNRDVGSAELELLTRFWALNRPEEASRAALAKFNPLTQGVALPVALRVWAEIDPQTATQIAWSWTDTHPHLQSVIPPALIRGWFAAGDPPELRQFIQDLGMGLYQQRALSAYVRILIQKKGSLALTRWAESVSEEEPKYKLAVYRQAAAALEQFDHDEALSFCAKHCDGEFGENLRTMIARRWMRRDGAGALTWLQNAPESDEKNFAARNTFALWARREPENAIAWMKARVQGEPDPWLKPIFPVYAIALGPTEPLEAIRWAEGLEKPDEQEFVFIEIARAWRKTDQAAADAWLEQSPLSEQARMKAGAKAKP
jgi:hypothetical protein